MISLTRLWAPNPMATPPTPAAAIREAVSTFSSDKIINAAAKYTIYLIRFWITAFKVLALRSSMANRDLVAACPLKNRATTMRLTRITIQLTTRINTIFSALNPNLR